MRVPLSRVVLFGAPGVRLVSGLLLLAGWYVVVGHGGDQRYGRVRLRAVVVSMEQMPAMIPIGPVTVCVIVVQARVVELLGCSGVVSVAWRCRWCGLRDG